MTEEKERLSELLEASIEMELNVSDLYRLYSEVFEQDRDFWWKLSMEEKNHAALLKSGRNFLRVGVLPMDVVCDNIEILNNVNSVLLRKIKEYRKTPPEMEEAYRYARGLENSAAEAHYQSLMQAASDNKVVEIFKKLGKDDINHSQRIEEIINLRLED